MWTKRALHLHILTGLLWLACAAQRATAQPVLAPPPQSENDACTDDPKCRMHDDQAATYFQNQKDYAKALVEFQRAFAVVPTPRLLLNIGRCFFRLGKAEEAIRYYERYQREVAIPSPTAAELLPRYLEEARSVLAAQQEVAPRVPSAPSEIPKPQKRPVYKQWWFWTTSSLVLSAAAIGIGVGIALNQPPMFNPTQRIW